MFSHTNLHDDQHIFPTSHKQRGRPNYSFEWCAQKSRNSAEEGSTGKNCLTTWFVDILPWKYPGWAGTSWRHTPFFPPFFFPIFEFFAVFFHNVLNFWKDFIFHLFGCQSWCPLRAQFRLSLPSPPLPWLNLGEKRVSYRKLSVQALAECEWRAAAPLAARPNGACTQHTRARVYKKEPCWLAKELPPVNIFLAGGWFFAPVSVRQTFSRRREYGKDLFDCLVGRYFPESKNERKRTLPLYTNASNAFVYKGNVLCSSFLLSLAVSLARSLVCTFWGTITRAQPRIKFEGRIRIVGLLDARRCFAAAVVMVSCFRWRWEANGVCRRLAYRVVRCIEEHVRLHGLTCVRMAGARGGGGLEPTVAARPLERTRAMRIRIGGTLQSIFLNALPVDIFEPST